MLKEKRPSVALFVVLGVLPSVLSADGLAPERLRCEYLQNPQGIEETVPRLSWIVTSTQRGQKQTAYQILVASSAKILAENDGDLWDTGKVESDETVNIPYDGRPLASRMMCYWKVRSWDKDREPSAWSAPAKWSMGLLDPADWTARYISYKDDTPVYKDPKGHFLPAARQYRKEFAASKEIKRATIYATTLGIFELHVNGKRVGDTLFAPGWTDYHQRAYYNTYDVTDLVRQGENAVGAWVADGWYSGYVGFGLLTGMGTEGIGRYIYGKTPSIMAQLEIEYTDGSHETIATDRGWKVFGGGPIRQADFLMGEFYDARMETPGWTQPDFDDSKWNPAILAEENGFVKARFIQPRNPPPGQPVRKVTEEIELGFRRPPKLEAFPGDPVRPIEELKPIEITSPAKGAYIFNLGQNFAGIDYIDTVFFAYDAALMSKMALDTGRETEYDKYTELHDNVAKAFEKKYIKQDGSLTVDTQTAYALALFAGLVPAHLREAAGQRLADKIIANDHRMATGFLGTKPLLPVLSSSGTYRFRSPL